MQLCCYAGKQWSINILFRPAALEIKLLSINRSTAFRYRYLVKFLFCVGILFMFNLIAFTAIHKYLNLDKSVMFFLLFFYPIRPSLII